MLGWVGEFFRCGHPFEYINDMSYWDFLEITNAIGRSREENTPSVPGQTSYRKLKPSQQLMIENRIKQREKEGIRSA